MGHKAHFKNSFLKKDTNERIMNWKVDIKKLLKVIQKKNGRLQKREIREVKTQERQNKEVYLEFQNNKMEKIEERPMFDNIVSENFPKLM